MPTLAAIWNGEDTALLVVCVVAGGLAFALFIGIFVHDIKDAKRRNDAKKAFERARKHFALNPDADQPKDEVPK